MLEHRYEVNWKHDGYVTVPFLDCISCDSSVQVSKRFLAAGNGFETQIKLLKSEHEIQALTEEVRRLKELVEALAAGSVRE